MAEHSKRAFPDIGFPLLTVPRSWHCPLLSLCLAHGLVLAIAVSLVTWGVHASWTAWKGAKARIEMTPAAGGAFSYRHFGLANPTSLSTTMATMLHKVTLQNQGAVQDIYVGHVATSGWLMALSGVTNDDAMHPDWPAVEAGAAYIGEPDKNPGSPVQYGWDSIRSVYWHGSGGAGSGYEGRMSAQTQWRPSQFGWTQFMLSVEDSGDYFKDVFFPWPPYYMPAAQTANLVNLFHVATVGIGGQEPTVPPSADGHQHLHYLGSAPTLSAFPNRVYLYAFGFQTGYFDFEVTQGGDKIDLISAYTGILSPNDKIEYTIATASNYVKVIVEAMAPSTAINDVTITVRWGEAQDRAIDIIDYKTTVWTPTMV